MYLILLLWAVASILDGDPRSIRKIMTIWVISAIGWAGIVIGAYYKLLPASLGDLLASYDTSGRVAGASENPNLAASYFFTSLFVLLATPRIPSVARLAASVVIIWAVVLTGSNGALLALLAGLLVVAIGGVVRRFAPMSRAVVIGGAVAAVTVAGTVFITVAGPPRLTTGEVDQLSASQTGGPLDNSVGRLNNSVGARLGIWAKGWSGGNQSMLVGLGPNASNQVEAIDKGLHNDYLAFLLERGIAGALALAAFLFVVLRWSASLLVARVPDRRKWALGGLAGGIVANLVMALTHESFHFRHLWLLLALAWVCGRLAAPAPRREPIPEPAPPRREPVHALG